MGEKRKPQLTFLCLLQKKARNSARGLHRKKFFDYQYVERILQRGEARVRGGTRRTEEFFPGAVREKKRGTVPQYSQKSKLQKHSCRRRHEG